MRISLTSESIKVEGISHYEVHATRKSLLLPKEFDEHKLKERKDKGIIALRVGIQLHQDQNNKIA